MTHTKTSDEADRRLKLLVSLVGLSALGVFAGVHVQAAHHVAYLSWETAGVAALVAICAWAQIPVRVRATRQSENATEVAVLIAVAMLPVPAALLAFTLGLLVATLALRPPPIKAIFNVGKGTLAAGAAIVVATSLGGFPNDANLAHLLGTLAAAGATYFAVNEAIAIPVIALATRTPIRQRLLMNWDFRLVALTARITLAAVAVPILRADTRMLVAVALLVLCLQLAYANRVRTRTEREAWQKLSETTDEFNAVDLEGVLHTAVKRAADLFSADEVEIEVRLAIIAPRLIRGGTTGIIYDGDPDRAPARAGNVIDTPLEGYRGTDDVGSLRLRFRGAVQLTDRERFTLSTFASALTTAVRNAAAYAELARLANQHAHDAAHDALTGLANRRRLKDEGTAALERRPVRGVTALLFVDLNHFKEVNDTLGHTAGDKVLIEVGRRLKTAAGDEALVARLGGDEFAVLLSGLSAPAVASYRAQSLLATLTEPIDLDGMPISVEASIGIATAPSRGGMVELMRRADVAMYEAKRTGQRTATYARARDTADVSRLTLGGDLSRAVAEQQFIVDFQPIVDLATGEAVAAEALARWYHPDKGALGPQRFLETVERSGILPAFADAVLDQALLAAVGWREAGFDLSVAVNVSPRSLLDRRFPEAVAARLRHRDVPADRVILELTESLTLSQLDVVDQVLTALHEQGLRLALDDFGTGYSSLAMLSRVPVHELKIDRDFIAAMESSAEAAAVVRSTVDLGRGLELTVVAEGIENEYQRRTLWELGCVAGQGHLFARPMSAARVLAALRRGSGGQPGTLAPPLHDAGTVIRIPRRMPPATLPDPGQDPAERLPHWPA